jgi:hypothetical protein
MIMMVFWPRSARQAAPKKGNGMTLDCEIGLFADGGELIDGQANIHLDYTVTLRAGQVMVMGTPTNTIVMRAVGKLNAIQQTHAKKHLNRAIDSRASQAGFVLPQILPQIINGEICPTVREFNQTFLDQAARARIALARFLKGCAYLICDHEFDSFLYFLTMLRDRPAFPGRVRQRPVAAREAQAA